MGGFCLFLWLKRRKKKPNQTKLKNPQQTKTQPKQKQKQKNWKKESLPIKLQQVCQGDSSQGKGKKNPTKHQQKTSVLK